MNLLVAHPVQWPTFLHFSYKIVIVIITPVKEGWIKGKLQIFFWWIFAKKPFDNVSRFLFFFASYIHHVYVCFFHFEQASPLGSSNLSSLLDYNKASSSSKFQPCFSTNWALSSFFHRDLRCATCHTSLLLFTLGNELQCSEMTENWRNTVFWKSTKISHYQHFRKVLWNEMFLTMFIHCKATVAIY